MPALGTFLAHYEIYEKLGAGGMGEVYRARDTKLNRDVAIKVLPPHLASDQEIRLRFEREARAIAQLSHPNVRAIYDFDVGETAFAVMEYLEGDPCVRGCGAVRFPWPTASVWVCPLPRGWRPSIRKASSPRPQAGRTSF
ncbi:protein kinase [Chloracidobacterium sp. S]|uniref:protein kinase domain-containing protein n=1 Tax=Chloracidobacterium aggregatum TaxID=2851959 RepID=UPI001B8D2922|nr:protein kinase [Chloracidobacterium aggregatum]QUV89566.1 protein kinase [Chloracidobacterium sp. S]